MPTLRTLRWGTPAPTGPGPVGAITCALGGAAHAGALGAPQGRACSSAAPGFLMEAAEVALEANEDCPQVWPACLAIACDGRFPPLLPRSSRRRIRAGPVEGHGREGRADSGGEASWRRRVSASTPALHPLLTAPSSTCLAFGGRPTLWQALVTRRSSLPFERLLITASPSGHFCG